ncbi:hypothetical protein [Calothrix sp. NIES-2098]|uniref:hypothetical protein n=1 Tax=Calothrix sp. NIES-2098 TaxID=1954171 RepID=UPI000B5DBCD5|nr:hypothetical protein NIES2098_47250 [Calothrix sp. NIES-2098]
MDTTKELALNGNGSTSAKQEKKPRVRRQYGTLPTANAGSLQDLDIPAKIDTAPTSFDSLDLYAMFCIASDGSGGIYVKVARNKYASLHSGKSDFVAGGRCYRVVL